MLTESVEEKLGESGGAGGLQSFGIRSQCNFWVVQQSECDLFFLFANVLIR